MNLNASINHTHMFYTHTQQQEQENKNQKENMNKKIYEVMSMGDKQDKNVHIYNSNCNIVFCTWL